MSININQVHFGGINPEETVESQESFTILFKRSLSQEPPQIKIIWQVEYTDVNGNLVVEEISLR